MSIRLFAGVVALAVVAVSGPVLADDPNDPVLSRNAAARAKDKAIIRQLNINELNRTRARDAEYAKGWAAYKQAPQARAQYSREMERYRAEREEYEANLAAWREAVRKCRAGDYRYCNR